MLPGPSAKQQEFLTLEQKRQHYADIQSFKNIVKPDTIAFWKKFMKVNPHCKQEEIQRN